MFRGATKVTLDAKGRLAIPTRYRDRIQFLWDQTVRGINKGMDLEQLTQFVQLPRSEEESYLTRQFYGLAEHHVRQIHNGLRGGFDGNPAKLFPDNPSSRAEKLVNGFGGVTRTQAIADDVEVKGAELKDGLLKISMERIVPEHRKAKTIDIK